VEGRGGLDVRGINGDAVSSLNSAPPTPSDSEGSKAVN
jgi:hypothetical protein